MLTPAKPTWSVMWSWLPYLFVPSIHLLSQNPSWHSTLYIVTWAIAIWECPPMGENDRWWKCWVSPPMHPCSDIYLLRVGICHCHSPTLIQRITATVPLALPTLPSRKLRPGNKITLTIVETFPRTKMNFEMIVGETAHGFDQQPPNKNLGRSRTCGTSRWWRSNSRRIFQRPRMVYTKSRWWFQIFFIFTPIWGRFPIWRIFFRWVETTN